MTKSAQSVLVVEDDVETGEMLVSILEREGYAVTLADSGTKAVRYARTSTADGLRGPDLLLLDLQLPDMDGTDVTRLIAESIAPLPPVVVLSARPTWAVRTAAKQIGAAATLRKPFDVQRLLTSIRVALQSRVASPALAPMHGASPELVVAMRRFEDLKPQLDGRITGGFDEVPSWKCARRVVELALRDLGELRLAALSYGVDLALQSYLATTRASNLLRKAHIIDGGPEIDFAITDAYCFALLQLAVVVTQHLLARLDASAQ
ncbi:MAG: hypothetical protein NVS3B10_18300 [Polyangiales bacterium]